MGLVNKPNTFSNGNVADATEVNSNFDVLYNLVNGDLDDDNIDFSLSTVKAALLSALKDVDGEDSGLDADTVDGNEYLDILKTVYPIGSQYVNFTDGTNPGTLFGFGTWERIAEGRVVVGVDSADTDFDTAEETGGEKTHTLTESEMPSHNHSGSTSADGEHTHSFYYVSGDGSGSTGGIDYETRTNKSTITTSSNGEHFHTISSSGGGSAHNNLQPYITAYIWKRVA
jgi:hypothetical protein